MVVLCHVGFAEVQAGDGVEVVWVLGGIGLAEVFGVHAWGVGVEHGLCEFVAVENGGVFRLQVYTVLVLEWRRFLALERTRAAEHGAFALCHRHLSCAVVVAVAEHLDRVSKVLGRLAALDEEASDVLGVR